MHKSKSIIKKNIILILMCVLYCFKSFSQENLTSDELFLQAKKEAYERNNYPGAINILKKALIKSPNYADLRVFLGRLYTFSDHIDSAKTEFQKVFAIEPGNLDAINGSYDLAYWNNNYPEAVAMAETGIKYYPDSAKFYLQKAKALNAMNKPDEAITLMQSASSKFKTTPEIKSYLDDLILQKEQRIYNQNNPDSDSLFTAAKYEAYTNSNYPQAKILIKRAISQSPNYKDLQVFLGRIYTFTDEPDSAKKQFQGILNTDPNNTDAIDGLYDVEYWNDNYTQALEIAEIGINNYPDSGIYYLKKSKAINALKKPYDAISFLEDNRSKIEKDSAALAYLKDLKLDNLRHRVGAGYEYVDFDKRFDEPWHFGSLSYGYRSKFGRIIARLNYANRFDSQGILGEIEAYPTLKNIGYQYIGFAVSDSPIFPKFRAGYSLFASLPKSFEAEIGFRYLRFTEDTYLITAAIGRYVGNNFYNLRSFIAPDVPAWSYSFTASARFFMSDDMDDFFGVSVGTGISPDDYIREIFINSFANLKSYKAGLSFNKVVKRKDMFSVDVGWFIEEYNTKTWGNQYNVGFSYSRRF